MKKFKIEIIIPEKIFFEGEIDSLIVETPNGKIGILAGHASLVIGLKSGIIVMKEGGKEIEIKNEAGIVSVQPNKTVIYCKKCDIIAKENFA